MEKFIDWTEKYGQKGTGHDHTKDCKDDLMKSKIQMGIQARKFGLPEKKVVEQTPEQKELERLSIDLAMMERIIGDQKM